MTLKDYQNHWAAHLKDLYPSEEIRSLLIMGLAHRLSWSAVDLILQRDVIIPPEDLLWLNDALERLKNKQPMQQIMGYTWFCDAKFLVSSKALIPRPETEELVLYLRQKLKTDQVKVALDIGTGSGCIALSLAEAMIQTQWWAWDVSTAALALAKKNQAQFQQQVRWGHQDIFEPWPDQNFDLIVSNPPYIPEDEQNIMDKNVLEYEPHLALFVPSKDPLKFYQVISNKGLKHLNPNGQLYFECHYNYTQAVAQLMKSLGYTQVNSWKDQWGKWRFVSGIRP
jgi:release factor glutamine methyltransferase